MKLVDLTVREFIHEVDSAAPAPGGGSVSALSAALGASLLRMVGHLTIPKKKFNKLDESVQKDFIKIHENAKSIHTKLLDLIDRDTDAFNAIMNAYKLPKDSESDQSKRQKAIESATIKAIEVPLAIAELAAQALETADFILKYGNKNTISDIGVSVLTLYGGLEGACLNILINLPGLSDEELIKQFKTKAEDLINKATPIKQAVLEQVHQHLNT